eukprot:gnl/TRDRNA2_/TRDRNA2_85959_c0_seq1.p1 gnl/TRDRNA2_/TRDRNA2_85959_c0~~gnl/TRDRNA2_/TRDRNA2_85959_c0_seq1.p1  ORF type:complete len:410 (+),score=101.01 gnl/TRDRNA2_/TRDRNA2_85959_c0_seq1:32-1261(+)
MVQQRWEVVGGVDKGGILVREGQALNSPQASSRCSTGALLEEIDLVGERLHYKLVEGVGPATGWVSVTLQGKQLVQKTDKQPTGNGTIVNAAATPAKPEEEVGGPSTEGGAVDVDQELRKSYEKKAQRAAEDKEFNTWCFKYTTLGFPLPEPKLRIFCFHNAGSAESQWTTPATTALHTWIKESKQVELIAPSYPGRDKMLKAVKHESTGTLVAALLPVLWDKLADGVPFIFLAHSVGTWVAFEMLIEMRKCGLPMPKLCFFNSFAAPHMPVSMRPWRVNRRLSDENMQTELTNWDRTHFTGAGKVILDGPDWTKIWMPLMRADFRLFDEYKFKHNGAPKFDFPIHSFIMEEEFFIKQNMIDYWQDWTTNNFTTDVMKGMGHLTCFYMAAKKKEYFQKIKDKILEHVDL